MVSYKEFYFDNSMGEYWAIMSNDSSDLKYNIDLDKLPIAFDCIGNSTSIVSLLENTSEEFIYESCEWNFEVNGRLCPFLQNGKWGFINSKFQIVIEPMFDFVGTEVNNDNGPCYRPPIYFHDTKWVNGECMVVLDGAEMFIKVEGDFVHFNHPTKGSYQEKDKKRLDDVLKEGKKIKLSRNPKNNSLSVVVDGVYLGLDKRVNGLVASYIDANEEDRDELRKRLLEKCCVVELRQIDKNGMPIIKSINILTGEKTTVDWVPCLVLNNNSTSVDLEESPLQIERGTNYAYKLKYTDNPTFDKVRELSIKFYKELPKELQDELYEALNRGLDLLNSEPQMTAYLYAFGQMHQAKLDYAFKLLPKDFLEQPEINIIDYGCGQALGTMCYADYLRENGYLYNVKNITLIEPSEMCLKRAALHASVFFPNAKIKTVNKKFDELAQDDIICDEETPTLHIFSNVLDMMCYNLDVFSDLIKNCLKGWNVFVCVAPYFNEYLRDKRIADFTSVLCKNAFYEVLDKRAMNPNKDWTCALSVFSVGELDDLSTEVDDEELSQTVENNEGTKYSKDGKRMLKYTYLPVFKSYTIPAGVRIICDNAFSNKSSSLLIEIAIPSTVVSIGKSAFEGCSSLKKINIPKSVKNIGAAAFYRCSSLQQIEIPDSVRHIGEGAFGKCSALQLIKSNSSQFVIIDKMLIDLKSQTLLTYFGKDERIIIPDIVTNIGCYAFQGRHSIKHVRIPESVLSIGDSAFSDCSSLEQIVIPDSTKDIGYHAFSYCTSLRLVIIPNSVLDIGSCAFCNCKSLEQIFIPNSVLYIGSSAFSDCVSMRQIIISNSIKSIEHSTFSGCKSLQQLIIPDSVKLIDDSAFMDCTSLEKIVIPDSVESIGTWAFSNCRLLEQDSIPTRFNKTNCPKSWECVDFSSNGAFDWRDIDCQDIEDIVSKKNHENYEDGLREALDDQMDAYWNID